MLGVAIFHQVCTIFLVLNRGPSFSVVFSIEIEWLREIKSFSIKMDLKKCALMHVANKLVKIGLQIGLIQL